MLNFGVLIFYLAEVGTTLEIFPKGSLASVRFGELFKQMCTGKGTDFSQENATRLLALLLLQTDVPSLCRELIFKASAE